MKTKICGIYKITSPSKKIYIGQSINIEKRFKIYKGLYCKKQSKLYNSLLKYGVEKHKFEVIHQCSPEQLNELEKYYVDLFQCFNSKYGLNLREGGGSKGKISDETRLKISISNTGKKCSEDTKQKISDGNKGKTFSLETKMKLSAIGKVRKYSEETKKKMSSSRTGIKLSKETKQKMRLYNKGKILSKEHKIKIGLANKGHIMSDEQKLILKQPKSEKTRNKISKALKKYYINKKYGITQCENN